MSNVEIRSRNMDPAIWEKSSETELLAIILWAGQGTFKAGVRERNATDFARGLLKDFNGLRDLDRAHVQGLLKVPGLGPAEVGVTQVWRN